MHYTVVLKFSKYCTVSFANCLVFFQIAVKTCQIHLTKGDTIVNNRLTPMSVL